MRSIPDPSGRRLCTAHIYSILKIPTLLDNQDEGEAKTKNSPLTRFHHDGDMTSSFARYGTTMKLLQSTLLIGLITNGTMAANPIVTDTVHQLSTHHSIGRHRGGAGSLKTKVKPPSLTEFKSKTSCLAEKFIETTLYSKENQPESDGQAEWTGFLSGWMLVALPVPLPILVSVLIMNTLILMRSKWEERVKNRCLIGFAHGVTFLFVLLRELEAQISSIQPGGVSPRVALMGLNVATTLLFGRAGTYAITKRLMDIAIWATLLYVIIHYFR